MNGSNYYMFDKAFMLYALQDPVVIFDGDGEYNADRKFVTRQMACG
ncbi:hypothetical protein J5069_15395 [Candidatus Symbiopectobacterium sp. NZEC127]|nr:hypothetical protein [Candidatus Symbiopectobacterium sp. NZEC127]MCW2487282.1 hypothetical protein [Candidatus Symbiopectobacterium sp. NZEC127]